MITENDVILIPGICTTRHALIHSLVLWDGKKITMSKAKKTKYGEMQIDSAKEITDYKINDWQLNHIQPLHRRVQICLRLAHLPPAALVLYSRFHANSGAGSLCFCSAPA